MHSAPRYIGWIEGGGELLKGSDFGHYILSQRYGRQALSEHPYDRNPSQEYHAEAWAKFTCGIDEIPGGKRSVNHFSLFTRIRILPELLP